MDAMTLINLVFVFVLAIFLGFELIAKVPSTLHTPLMSGSNAISVITVVGALLAAGTEGSNPLCVILGTAAVALALIISWAPPRRPHDRHVQKERNRNQKKVRQA